MKLWDIAKTVGAGIFSVAVPGGAKILETVNDLLPDDSKLLPNATGNDIQNAVESLPPEQKAAVMEKEFDVEITQIQESNSTLRAMLESDAQNPHSTRPYIAKGSFHVVAFTVIVAVSIWAYGVLIENIELVKSVMDGWPFILSVIAPLITLLWAYFGILKQEHKNKLNAVTGSMTTGGLTGILSTILKK